MQTSMLGIANKAQSDQKITLVLLRKRVFTKSPVRENRTPGSVRGLPGNWQSYRAQLLSDPNHGNAQLLPNLAGAVVWNTSHKNFKRSVNPASEAIWLQTLLETALATGNLIAFWGSKLVSPPNPRGGTWAVDVYSIDGVILYNMH